MKVFNALILSSLIFDDTVSATTTVFGCPLSNMTITSLQGNFIVTTNTTSCGIATVKTLVKNFLEVSVDDVSGYTPEFKEVKLSFPAVVEQGVRRNLHRILPEGNPSWTFNFGARGYCVLCHVDDGDRRRDLQDEEVVLSETALEDFGLRLSVTLTDLATLTFSEDPVSCLHGEEIMITATLMQ